MINLALVVSKSPSYPRSTNVNLTAEDILSMPAGKGMDELIHNALFPEESEMGVLEYSRNYMAFQVVKLEMTREFHWKIQSPFCPGRPWLAGLTLHHEPGQNGIPDFFAPGDCEEEAGCRAALLALSYAQWAARLKQGDEIWSS